MPSLAARTLRSVSLCLVLVLGSDTPVAAETPSARPRRPSGSTAAAAPARTPRRVPPKTRSSSVAVDCGALECTLFSTPIDAFRQVLATKPEVLGVGEVHQTNATVRLPSAIHRFTTGMLPAVAHRASDLILETWITKGSCGEAETQAVTEIEEKTDRPAKTEDEIVTLIVRARALGMLPHILEVECEEYRALFGEDGEMDDDRILKLVTRLLLEKAKKILERHRERDRDALVIIYGGALHNDVEPSPELAPYSYGKELDRETIGRYVELDLYVPELIDHDEDYAKEAWYAYFERYTSKTKTLLIRVGPAQYRLIFPRTRGGRAPPAR